MHIDYLILADGADAVNGKLYLLGGGWDRVMVERGATASAVRGDIALGVRATPAEAAGRHTLTLRLVQEADDAEVFRIDAHVENAQPSGQLVGADFGLGFVFKGPFPVRNSGLHRVVVDIDGHRQDQAVDLFVTLVDTTMSGSPN